MVAVYMDAEIGGTIVAEICHGIKAIGSNAKEPGLIEPCVSPALMLTK